MITGIVLARNEAGQVVECLKSFREHVDELLLIDMESEDDTRQLAEPLVDKLLSHPKTPNFDAARNIAIDEAKFGWLWFCDADERIPSQVAQMVRDLVKNRGHEFEALYVPFKSYFCGKWIEHCGWWPGYTMPRVLKRGHFRFREQLHGGVEVQGREVKLPPDPANGVDHYSYESVEHYFEKFNRYTSTEAAQLAAAGNRWDWRTATQAMVRDLWMYYERNQGKLDAAHGWILSWLGGQYRWASQAKLIDHGLDPAAKASCPEDLDEFLEEFTGELSRLRANKPKLPLGVLWRSPIYDPSGYADEGRCFVKSLAGTDRQMALEAIPWSDKTCELPKLEVGYLKALEAAQRPAHYLAITNCIPTLVQPDPAAAVNVLRTTFETDRIPPEWHAYLEPFDEIWVISQHNYQAFVRSGIAPEKLRVVPSCMDVSGYGPEGDQLELPREARGRFVYLSVFDWQLRKGWDVLLKAYVREFSMEDNTALLLKVSLSHGHPLDLVKRQVEEVLSQAGTSLAHRPDIVFWDEILEAEQMAAMYRSVDAFVLPTRGEGWGRTYMEAMACGLPTIGTAASGNIDFMTTENSFLVDAELIDVPEAAADEIPPFRGHRWHEPSEEHLRQQMRTVFEDEDKAKQVGAKAVADIEAGFGLSSGRQSIDEAISAAEARFASRTVPPPKAEQLQVELHGDLLANHSFSNINETLMLGLGEDDDVALSFQPRFIPPGALEQRSVRTASLRPYIGRELSGGPQVTIRHAYPPDWTPLKSGKWVHIQPWEFGYLPQDWIEPLKHRVDEIWAPSSYVKQVYVDSGIPESKVYVIPWGIDETIFRPDAPPRHLATKKSFRLLYVGGSIARKGFDILLDAYLAEFKREDDVCLVIKDLGHNTVYRYGNCREQIFEAMARPDAPEIVYFDDDMTPGQLASLYTACDCLVAPYRGEGFGLPILEGMACSLMPIVTAGGPSDDFVMDEWGVRVRSQPTSVEHPETLCGPPTELVVPVEDLRRALRDAYAQPEQTRERGASASKHALGNYTWRQSMAAMKERMRALAADTASAAPAEIADASSIKSTKLPISVVVATKDSEEELADCLARISSFAEQTIVADERSSDRSQQIAVEYHADVVTVESSNKTKLKAHLGQQLTQPFQLWLTARDKLQEGDWAAIRGVLEGSGSPTITLSSGREVEVEKNANASTAKSGSTGDSDALASYHRRFHPYLGKRADTFLKMLEYLQSLDHSPTIVETGCIRLPDDWGAGQSTLIFDDYVGRVGGRLTSVDITPASCEFARRHCQAEETTVVNDDSVRFLARYATEHPESIDLLYLDSYDVDWDAPHASALHHLQELCAARPALKPGAMVVVDDHQDEQGRPGKSHYVADYMQSIGARCVFAAYQIGWII